MEIGRDEFWQGKHINTKLSQEFWDYRAYEFNMKMEQERSRRQVNGVIDFLNGHQVFHESAHVLDIGCGPGNYTLALAEYAEKVVAMDVSEKMLDFAKKNAWEREIDNIELVHQSWEEKDLKASGWERKFDLVFASMCPGINSAEMLRKMIDASCGHCFLSGFVVRTNRFTDTLNEHIYGKSTDNSHGDKIHNSFNTLWRWGFHPEIRYVERQWGNTVPIDQFVEQYRLQMKMRNRWNEENKRKAHEFIQAHSQDGQIKEKTYAKIAWMYWRVN